MNDGCCGCRSSSPTTSCWSLTNWAEPVNDFETVRRERRPYLAGANPARQLSLQPVAVRATEGGNDMD